MATVRYLPLGQHEWEWEWAARLTASCHLLFASYTFTTCCGGGDTHRPIDCLHTVLVVVLLNVPFSMQLLRPAERLVLAR